MKTYNFETVSKEPQTLGDYTLKNASGKTIYIGKGKLRDRLQRHLPSGSVPVKGAKYYSVHVIGDNTRAKNHEKRKINNFKSRNKGKLPRSNQRIG